MRKKVAAGAPPPPEKTDPVGIREEPRAETVSIPFDASNEAMIVASAWADAELRAKLLSRLVPDHFQQREHRDLWQAFQEAERRKLVLDLALVEQLASADVARYMGELAEVRPEPAKNLGFHLQNVLWDHARASAARGPIPAFIEALRDPKAEPERVRGLARSIVQSFDGYEDRRFLLDGDALVRDQMKEIEARVAGRACWPFGLPGLDYFDRTGPRESWRRRMLPGSAPGQVTVITGVSGGGKTTTAANLVLGMAFPGWREGDFETPGRRILYGAWEVKGGMTCEILAGISLSWQRDDLIDPQPASPNREASPLMSPEGRAKIRERMTTIKSRISFLANPFRRQVGEKGSNQRNLDILQGYIADSGCEVFVGDLWKRCLAARESGPEDEEEALIRQQTMADELHIHAILLQQQRLKDIEQRPDKRPTREGIKGSSAWVEVADTIIGVHRPYLFKRVSDNKLEIFVLKQRYGKWPLGVEFDWDPDRGKIWGGKPIDYDRPGEVNEIDHAAGLAETMRGRRRR